MKYKKIVLAGGNGYLGRVLAEYYRYLADDIIILSRRKMPVDGNIKTIVWDGSSESDWVQHISDADMLINLCGKNVNCRYTKIARAEIINSRTVPTELLGKVIQRMTNPPKLWINITSATIYRHAEDRFQDEMNGDLGYGFSVDVCKLWEKAFFDVETKNTRKVALRMGIVFGRADGAFPRLLNLVRFGLGGMQGDGKQYVSWIHEQDAAKCTEWLMNNKELAGVINCTAPQPLKNADLMNCIRNAYGVKIGLSSPAWLLETGAMVIGTETELILKSRWVMPGRLMENGYKFLFPKAEHAIKDILSIQI
ncbi:TIGR01777 family oxidoreductase [Dyadobacter psychrotolerans]|uniref:TIGR01777 family protein n=1 Tax=Dyadobacter psychrotolerans TaxID=2541721 RepID=A0A4V2Z3I3_9BACT|nr:TIGR01777 family oxidoreductase [Dyadobacter psychrotolerans]TDE12788.1 TIGR01777 family protein [Dyadobacter psychrotolerans]